MHCLFTVVSIESHSPPKPTLPNDQKHAKMVGILPRKRIQNANRNVVILVAIDGSYPRPDYRDVGPVSVLP